jgi:hypothetical protein
MSDGAKAAENRALQFSLVAVDQAWSDAKLWEEAIAHYEAQPDGCNLRFPDGSILQKVSA